MSGDLGGEVGKQSVPGEVARIDTRRPNTEPLVERVLERRLLRSVI